MATLNAVLAVIETRIGFPRSRGRTVARRLQETSIIPSGAPGLAPDLDVDHFVSLVIAIASDAPLHKVADAVGRYRQLGLPGHDASGMPASVAAKYHCAGDHLEILADIALNGDPRQLSKAQIEIGTAEEIAIHWRHGEAERFAPAHTLHGHWQHSGHRRSTTIEGAAFVDAIQELFGEK